MISAMGHHDLIGDFLRIQLRRIITSRGNCFTENLGDRGSLNTDIFCLDVINIVGHDPTLTVCRPGQGDGSLIFGDKILYFNGVANGKNIGINNIRFSINDLIIGSCDNVSPGTAFKVGIFCQTVFRNDANR